MPVVCQTLLATVTRADPCNSPRLYEVSLQWERQRGLVLPNSGRMHGTDHSAYGIPCTRATQQPCKKDSKTEPIVQSDSRATCCQGQGSTSGGPISLRKSKLPQQVTGELGAEKEAVM